MTKEKPEEKAARIAAARQAVLDAFPADQKDRLEMLIELVDTFALSRLATVLKQMNDALSSTGDAMVTSQEGLVLSQYCLQVYNRPLEDADRLAGQVAPEPPAPASDPMDAPAPGAAAATAGPRRVAPIDAVVAGSGDAPGPGRVKLRGKGSPAKGHGTEAAQAEPEPTPEPPAPKTIQPFIVEIGGVRQKAPVDNPEWVKLRRWVDAQFAAIRGSDANAKTRAEHQVTAKEGYFLKPDVRERTPYWLILVFNRYMRDKRSGNDLLDSEKERIGIQYGVLS